MSAPEFTPEELVAQLLCSWREFFTTSESDYDRTKAAFEEAQARTIAAYYAIPARDEPVPPQGAGAEAPKTLRDEFAAKAMAALIIDPTRADQSREECARLSYLMADAMMQARKGGA